MSQGKVKKPKPSNKEIVERRKKQIGRGLKGLLIFLGVIFVLYFGQLAYAIVWVSSNGNAIAATAAAVIFIAAEIAFIIAYFRIIKPFFTRKLDQLIAKIKGH